MSAAREPYSMRGMELYEFLKANPGSDLGWSTLSDMDNLPKALVIGTPQLPYDDPRFMFGGDLFGAEILASCQAVTPVHNKIWWHFPKKTP